MFALADTLRFYVELQTSNGGAIPLGPGNISSLSIIEDKDSHLPITELSFADMTDAAARGALSDGALINIALGPDSPDAPFIEHTFRVFSPPLLKNTTLGRQTQLTGILDKVKFLRGIYDRSHEGPSSEAIKNIVNSVGINLFDAHKTADKMVWLPTNKPASQLIRFIADRGYRSAESAMQLALTDFGLGKWTVRYKDLAKQMQGNASHRFVSMTLNPTKYDYQILDHNIESVAGFNNNYAGYASKVILPQVTGEFNINSVVDVLLSAGSLNMSNEIKELFANGPGTLRQFLPLNIGNVHEKFGEAINQNRRIKSTFTTKLYVLTDRYTDIGLLDSVDCLLADASGLQMDETFSGRYVVTNKVRYVAGTAYREKFILQSQGTNS